jgi:hypothetical protein
MSSASNLWQRLGGAPDPRSDGEVAGDIDAELAFHIEQRERELVASGLAPEAAHVQALARFGNIDKVRAECRRVQLGGRIMLQRVTLVLLVLLVAVVAWLGVLNFTSRRVAEAEIASLKAQISRLETAAAAPVEALEDLESIMADLRNQRSSGDPTFRKLLYQDHLLDFIRTREPQLEIPTSETRVIFSRF